MVIVEGRLVRRSSKEMDNSEEGQIVGYKELARACN